MNRRQLLKLAPIAPVAMVAVAEGVHRVELRSPGHFLFFIDANKLDIERIVQCGNEQVPLLPKGSTGGWIIPVDGDVDGAVRIFRLDGEVTKEDLLPDGSIPRKSA